ncbi:hypothetical protein B7495_13960 [Cryobacterium sp. LW097]|uniref:DUF3054 domain-containing protein n=1 Tax=unclassified Cryobacterium TaxID=2649013 RepID=UPI000B4DCC45|nr:MULTISPECIES: DUF3054 domain-containing protein [unclassified Cryobacterium]ASD23067.1 hypothetical protein B7495_13960 [Cryobacterium sp. LW097]TFC59995.1 DUF3054 domain-containing protein [Cryobacterium sp. TMB1-7]
MPNRNASLAIVSLAAGLDAAMLLLFVVIGRASHGEGLWGVLVTWWPFLAGLVVAWLVLTARRTPLRIVWTGVGVWLITVVVAMLLRVVSGQGVQLSFVIVTFLVLGVFLLGWRAIALLVQRQRRRGASVEGSRLAG